MKNKKVFSNIDSLNDMFKNKINITETKCFPKKKIQKYQISKCDLNRAWMQHDYLLSIYNITEYDTSCSILEELLIDLEI